MSIKTELLEQCKIADKKLAEAILLSKKPPSTIKEQPTQPPILALPPLKDFKEFYDDFILFKTPLSASISDNLITIKNTTPNAKSLQASIYGVIELLADKYNCPVSNFYTKGNIQPPTTDFEKIDSVLQEKMKWVSAFFTNILQYSDTAVKKTCDDHLEMMTLPLVLRLRFYEWEKSIEYLKIQKAIDAGLKDRDKQLVQIQKDYADKLEHERVYFRTELDRAKNKVADYKLIASRMKEEHDSIKSKYDGMEDDLRTVHQKADDMEAAANRSASALSDMRSKVEKMERELKKYTEQPWVVDITSTADKPTFRNTSTGETIVLPPIDEFKNNYRFESTDNGILIYTFEDKKINVPESLSNRLNELTKTMTPPIEKTHINEPTSPKKKLSVQAERIFDALIEKEGQTQSELSLSADVKQKHIYRYMEELESHNKVEKKQEDEDGKKICRYYIAGD